MDARNVTFNISDPSFTRIATTVRDHYRSEFDRDYPVAAVESALIDWLQLKVDGVLEEVTEVLTTPGSRESSEFAQILMRTVKTLEHLPVMSLEGIELDPMFAGYRQFSSDRITAMMGYLSQKGIELYKTKLNKLLFYADMTGFYLTGRGLSGAQYVNLPYGPVPDRFEELIELGAENEIIRPSGVPGKDRSVQLIEPGTKASVHLTKLSDSDRLILDWVVDTYGRLTTTEITDVSHNELAYTNTRPGDRIAYRYAAFLKTLPPKDLLDPTDQ